VVYFHSLNLLLLHPSIALLSIASFRGVAGITLLNLDFHFQVNDALVRYVTELAPFSADQQIQRDLQRLFGRSANPYP